MASTEERNGEKRVGLPHRIVDILEGESLVNNATGLLALEFGVAMVVSGQTPTVGDGFSRLTYLTFAGLALGLIVGAIVERVHRHIDDGPIEITLTILVPYVTYLGRRRFTPRECSRWWRADCT